MFRNRLIALEHPTPHAIDFSGNILFINYQVNIYLFPGVDQSQFASTILWLEDQKIRHYKIEDREPLRQIGISDNWLSAWEEAYSKYKGDIKMPNFKSPLEELSWLMSYAVRLEYLDNGTKHYYGNPNLTIKLISFRFS